VKPLAPILMGSKSDLDHGQKIAAGLAEFGIETEIRVASAHKVAEYLLELLGKYEASGRPVVYVTIAGRSNALSGLVDGHVIAPVVACPPPSNSYGGADIFSSLRMPSGVTPAVVLEPRNAALLVAKMFSLSVPGMAEKVSAAQKAYKDAVISADQDLNS
jgi:phosphoribosylaminoimidazole carboxylase PurE protein